MFLGIVLSQLIISYDGNMVLSDRRVEDVLVITVLPGDIKICG